MGTHKKLYTFLEPEPGGIIFFWIILKAKNNEKLKQFLIFPLSKSKNHFAHFGGLK